MAIRDLWQVSQTRRLIGGLNKGDLRAWALLLSPFLICAVIVVPKWQASQVTQDSEKYFEAENKARSTLLQGIGGAFFFVTAYVALKQLKVAEDNRQLTEDKNLTDRFVKAAEMLADGEKMMARLAGIYALERVARDSPGDHWTVIQLLISFIEVQTKGSGEPDFLAKDVTAALTVIGKRNVENDPKLVIGNEHKGKAKLEISFAWLRFAALSSLNFDGAIFELVNLSNSQLADISFKGASFHRCILSQTDFTKGKLTEATFDDECNLQGAKFDDAGVNGAKFIQCDLTNAIFCGADLSKACFFEGSNIFEVDFSSAKGLTEPEQVVQARNWKQAFYSPEFVNKLPLTDEERKEMALIRQNILDEIERGKEILNDWKTQTNI